MCANRMYLGQTQHLFSLYSLTYVKLWSIPPVALYLHGKEETAVMLGFCAQAEAFDVPCP